MVSKANLMYGTPAFNLSSSVGKPNKKRALPAEDNNTEVPATDTTETESHSRSASGQSLIASEQLSSPSGDSAPSKTLASAFDAGDKSPSEGTPAPALSTTSSGVELSEAGASPAGEECGAPRAQAATQLPSAGTGDPATGASAAAASGGAGAKLPRKSSLRNRSQLTTMASVSEQEEREHAEGSLLSSLFSDRALLYKSLLSRYSTALYSCY